MANYLKASLIVFLLSLSSWLGFRAYLYFFSLTKPTLEISGIEENKYYSGDLKYLIKMADNYNISNISIFLDGNPLITNFKINKKQFEYTCNIPANTLENGVHKLNITAENGTFHKLQTSKELNFIVDNLPLYGAFVKNFFDNKVFQGRTLHIQFKVNKEIESATATYLSNEYNCFPESNKSQNYECFIPVDCEIAPGEYPVIINIVDKVGNKLSLETKLKATAFAFKKQVIKITPEKIKEANNSGLSEKIFEEKMEEITAKSPKKKLWQGLFITPIEIKDKNQITTEFGVVRATQERGLRQHKALDMYTNPKSVVWASQDGIVALKDSFVHSGNTIAIDHGYGLISLYFHLDSFADIEVGDKIKKGNPIGKLGKTGYATGYHLHWEMRLNNVPVYPLEWTQQTF